MCKNVCIFSFEFQMGKDPDVRVDQLFVVGEKMPVEVYTPMNTTSHVVSLLTTK